MSSLYGDPSQALDGSGVTPEQRLSYEQNHLLGKRVRLF